MPDAEQMPQKSRSMRNLTPASPRDTQARRDWRQTGASPATSTLLSGDLHCFGDFLVCRFARWLGQDSAFRDFAGQDIAKSLKFVSRQDCAQLVFHAAQAGVMAQARLERTMNTRLIRIKLPRMQVHNNALTIIFLECAERMFRERGREDAQISSAGHGKVCACQTKRGGRKLAKFQPIAARMRVRKSLRAGNAVKIVMNRIDA